MKALDRVWIGLTFLLLGLTVVSCICVASVFVNPEGVFSFLAPPTVPLPAPVATVPPFSSPTPIIVFPTLPPEWTPTTAPSETATEVATEVDETPPGITGGDDATHTPVPSPVGPTATDTEGVTPTRTATVRVPAPTRTRTPGSYPGQLPTATATGGGYP